MSNEKASQELMDDIAEACVKAARNGMSLNLILASVFGSMYGLMRSQNVPAKRAKKALTKAIEDL